MWVVITQSPHLLNQKHYLNVQGPGSEMKMMEEVSVPERVRP